jgi:pyruvate dehydrogenase E2 component (dihydrolipoamide acetyltransferase)
MLFDFKLPDIGEGVHEGTILEWKCALGDSVQEGDILAVVETDKVVAEIPSPRCGFIRKLGPAPGKTIRVGDILARIEIEGQEGQSVSVVGNLESSASELIGASREGMQRDRETHQDSEQKVKATPVARRLAAVEGIELSTLQGNGPAGRILKEDILRELQSRQSGDGRQNSPGSLRVTTAANDPSGPETLSTLRKAVARNLETSWKIPAALVHDFAVVDDLVEARRSLNRDAEKTAYPSLSFLPFFIKAAAASLKEYPLLNSWYGEKDQSLNPRDDINIGFALDSADGLVVPVIEAADRLSLSEIQEQINLRRKESSTRNLQLESLRGGTFTVSNYGSIGGTYGRPMILPPQVAILGLGRIHQAPIAKEGELAVGTILPLSFVFDHRVCDGAYAVRFLNSFIELVTKPLRILR